jgi:hypothetical protein
MDATTALKPLDAVDASSQDRGQTMAVALWRSAVSAPAPRGRLRRPRVVLRGA